MLHCFGLVSYNKTPLSQVKEAGSKTLHWLGGEINYTPIYPSSFRPFIGGEITNPPVAQLEGHL